MQSESLFSNNHIICKFDQMNKQNCLLSYLHRQTVIKKSDILYSSKIST